MLSNTLSKRKKGKSYDFEGKEGKYFIDFSCINVRSVYSLCDFLLRKLIFLNGNSFMIETLGYSLLIGENPLFPLIFCCFYLN